MLLLQGSHSTGKTGKMVKSNSRQGKHREFQNFGITQGKHREFENLMRESQDQDNNSEKNYCVMSMVLFLKLKLLSLYGNTQGKLKLHSENTGKMQGTLLTEMSGNHVLGLEE